ncbi:DnaJ domain-containing protein [Lacrimispora sp.]|uniref:DnaJ domain-containing protein n=1 Tax=Lacrimispora sp. TaxID=2719234 RepID=UPI0039916E78
MLDYYQILEVTSKATEKDIKAAYRRLAKKYHPDVIKDDPDGNKRMYEIQEAYGVLGDEEKRKQYDSVRTGERERSRETADKPAKPAPDMSQFEHFFGFQPGKGMETYRGSGNGEKKQTGPVNPEDLFAAFFRTKK